MYKASSIACVVFLFLGVALAIDYAKAIAMEKWGFESEGQILRFDYDCKHGIPKQKEGPKITLVYDLFGQKKEHKTEWWASGDRGYCNLGPFSRIKITSLVVNVGESRLVFSASDFEIDNSKSMAILLWVFLFFAVVTGVKSFLEK